MKGIYKTGAELRDIGMKKAVDNADNSVSNWSELAYSFLLKFIKSNSTFMAEDVRIASIGIVPEPPSLRSWGLILVKASKNNLIESHKTSKVKNPKAHSANANVWNVKIRKEWMK